MTQEDAITTETEVPALAPNTHDRSMGIFIGVMAVVERMRKYRICSNPNTIATALRGQIDPDPTGAEVEDMLRFMASPLIGLVDQHHGGGYCPGESLNTAAKRLHDLEFMVAVEQRANEESALDAE